MCRWLFILVAAAVSASLLFLNTAPANEPPKEPAVSSAVGESRGDDSDESIRQVQQLVPRPVAPTPAFAPAPPAAPAAVEALRQSVPGGAEATVRVTTDAGSLLGKSNASQGVAIQRRTPIVNEPRPRGERTGQLVAGGGAYWVPARQDLDTLVNKLDSSLINDILVIKGPYSALYGPGFSFVDTHLVTAPRYESDYQWEAWTRLTYQTNGEQWFGSQTLMGGSTDWGWRLDYGHRTGNDYETGDGRDIPASYNSRDVYGVFGMDLSPDSSIEFSVLRLDQTGVEFPAQAFDIDFLVTDAYEVKYALRDQAYFDRLLLDVWYNRTRFEGNSQGSGKRRQNPILDEFQFFGLTNVDLMSTGFSLALTWGEAGEPQLTAGPDLRFIKQEVAEINRFRAVNFIPSADPNFDPTQIPSTVATGPAGLAVFPLYFADIDKRVPRSHSTNPGLFVEQLLPVGDDLMVRGGGRVDWVSTSVEEHRLVQQFTTPGFFLAPDVLVNPAVLQPLIPVVPGPVVDVAEFLTDEEFTLWSLYLTGECRVSENWTALSAAGYAMRPPTLTELYSFNGPFLAILQRGGNFVFGNPDLDAERLWQMDVGLRADYDGLRGGVNGFHAWIHDYITLRQIVPHVTLLPQGRTVQLVQFVNTDLATLTGGEAFTEYDVTPWLTGFATVSYVEGRDHTRDRSSLPPPLLFPPIPLGIPQNEPLPGIAPLEARLGLRVHEPHPRPRWGVELSARVVENQDRVARSLGEVETPGFTIWDVRGYWQARENLLLIAGVENFTDKLYREHLDLRTATGFFQPGVNFYFGFELGLGPRPSGTL